MEIKKMNGFIIQMPYDEAVGIPVIISIVPINLFDFAAIERHKKNIIAEVSRKVNESDTDLKIRIAKVADELRRKRTAA